MEKQEIRALKSELRLFNSSDIFYQHSCRHYHYSEGVCHLVERAKCHWLLDHIVFNQTLDVLKDQSFQVWKVIIDKDQTTRILVEDEHNNHLTSFRLGFTDFPLKKCALWLVDKTIFLPSEY